MTRSKFDHLTAGRFFWLLGAMIASLVVVTLTPPGVIGRWESAIPLLAILIAGSYAARGGTKGLAISIGLNVILAIAVTLAAIIDSPAAQFAVMVLLLICLLFNLKMTLSFVLSGGGVEPDHIYGAICSYVLIGMCFATVYTLQAMTIPGAISGVPMGPGDRPFEDLFYFSITTLSTVGYGDIVPVHRSARAMCNVEMLVGTFYVAILVARLAGLYPPAARDVHDKR